MSQKINLKILGAEIKGRVREFYPYFLGFYLLSLIVAAFSKVWSSFFYWPAFNVSIIFFTLLFLLTFEFKFNFKTGLIKYSSHQIGVQVINYLNQFKKINRRSWLKIIAIIIILIFALAKHIGVVDFLILTYALISIAFVLNSRLAAGAALIFLSACPFLLIFKKDSLAEVSAIYAYYFLVITVITQIRELKNEKK